MLRNIISLDAFAKRFGMRRSVVLSRIKSGALTSQRDRKGDYYIPLAEVKRLRKDIREKARVLMARRADALTTATAIDEQVAAAAALVQEASAALASHTVGSPAWNGARKTLGKALDAHFKATELEVPYFALAKRIQSDADEFMAQFHDDGVEDVTVNDPEDWEASRYRMTAKNRKAALSKAAPNA